MIKSKKYYAQRVILGLQNDWPSQDWKMDERLVFPVLDDVVNGFAEQNYFDNWKMCGESIDEGFVTTWDGIEVTDGENEMPSYFTFPSNYAALPNNAGIIGVIPEKFQMRGEDAAVVVLTYEQWLKYKNMPAGSFQGRPAGYPKGSRFIFTSCGVKKKYGSMTVRLAVRNASDIANDQPYGIPSNFEDRVIKAVMEVFVTRRLMPTDQVRDKKDVAA